MNANYAIRMDSVRDVVRQKAAEDAATIPHHDEDDDADPMKIARWGLLLGSALADAKTTQDALNRVGTKEGNGVMAPIAGHPAALYAVKLGTNAAGAALLDKLHETHPKLANVMAVALSALQGGVAAHNTTVGRKR